MDKRELINIVGPALRSLTAHGPSLGVLRYEDSQADDSCDLRIALPAEASAPQVIDVLRQSVSDSKARTVLVEGLGLFHRVDDATHPPTGRIAGKVAVVTGAAQGFGLQIAHDLVEQGAFVALTDVNIAGVNSAANTLCKQFGQARAIGLPIDVTDSSSVVQAAHDVVRSFGGLDILISNTGVLRAESVKTQSQKDFDFVTSVNYKGYFLCVQKFAPIMAVQHLTKPGIYSDIIQINSKSGLVGSNLNAAYAGSKFGAIGLTQSFALELIEDRIKVNAVCPGNFFDGSLWSDPDNGLFVQYLRANKIPGAKSVQDVRKAYEAKVPMGRGCTTADVMKAIYYLIEQKYETGQALPVTGGQIMLS